jgi:membrane protease YdiL (CAAX protease family)
MWRITMNLAAGSSTDPVIEPATSPVREMLRFGIPAVGLTWAAQLTFLVAGWPIFPALLIELVILLATAVRFTYRSEGRTGLRAWFAQALRWRFAVRWYVFALLAFPAVTILVAAATGRLHAPADGWLSAAASYVIATVLIGAVLGNVWEELAWTGALQRRLTAKVGLFRAAMLTAIPFALIHLPLAFADHGLRHTPVSDVAIDWVLLVAVAPFFRYLLALVWSRTGQSVLAVGLVHGSFNACASLPVVSGGWQYIAAAFLVAPVVALAIHRSRSHRQPQDS